MNVVQLQRGASKFNDPRGAMARFEEDVARAVRDGYEAMLRPYAHKNATERAQARPWEFVTCDTRNGSFDLLIPSPTDPAAIKTPIAAKMVDSKSLAGRVYVRPVEGTIDGATSYELGGHSDAVLLWSNGFEWKILSEYRPRKWVGGFGEDFTRLPAHTVVNGSQTINGREWFGFNVGNAASFAIVAGVGLRFVASATNHDYINATRTSPMLGAPVLGSLLPFYGVTNHIIRVQAHVVLENAGADYEGAFLVIEDVTTPANQNFQVKKNWDTAMQISAWSTESGTSTQRGSNTTPTDEVLVVTFEAPAAFGAGSGTYDGSGYLNAENPWHSEIQGLSPALMRFNTQPRVCVGFQTGNTNADLTGYLLRFQIDYAEKWPFVNP